MSNACESRISVLPLLKTILGFLLTLSSFVVYVYFVGFIHNSISTVVVEKYSVKVFQNKVPFFPAEFWRDIHETFIYYGSVKSWGNISWNREGIEIEMLIQEW